MLHLQNLREENTGAGVGFTSERFAYEWAKEIIEKGGK
jgi:hypothetical protein